MISPRRQSVDTVRLTAFDTTCDLQNCPGIKMTNRARLLEGVSFRVAQFLLRLARHETNTTAT